MNLLEIAANLPALVALLDQVQRTVAADLSWETKYSIVFSDAVSLKISELLQQMGAPLSYYDPDADYEDDVRAYATALADHVAELERIHNTVIKKE